MWSASKELGASFSGLLRRCKETGQYITDERSSRTGIRSRRSRARGKAG